MNRYIIGSLWDRVNRNGANKNFEYLFEGRRKIDELNNKAEVILNEAQQTNDMNENVQQQINTLIAESGTSDAEVLQARVDVDGNEYAVLKERLDEKEQNFSARLAQTVMDLDGRGLNIKTIFDAKGDGTTDDTFVIKDAITYCINNKLPLFFPPGVYMVRLSELFFTITTGNSLKMFGVGKQSVIKAIDGEVDARFSEMFHFRVRSNVEFLEIKDLYIDNNARGSAPPENNFDYEQSHTFRINAEDGYTLGEVSFENVTINDPVADGFNNSGVGVVELFKVINCKVTNRNRTRSDIQFSQTPELSLIDNFVGDVIESESLSERNCIIKINNSYIKRLDGDIGHLGKIYVANTTISHGAYFLRCLVSVSNSSIHIDPINNRWNAMVYGSKVANSEIYLPVNSDGLVTPLDVRSYDTVASSHKQGVDFLNCNFNIDSDISNPSGYLVIDPGVVGVDMVNKPIKRFINCHFDERAGRNVNAHRNGYWVFDGCSFSGTDYSLRCSVTPGHFVNIHINNANFLNVTGDAFYILNYYADNGSNVFNLINTGFAIGDASTRFRFDRDIQRLRSNRVLLNHNHDGGIIGDMKLNENGVYKIATANNNNDALWKELMFVGA